MINVRLETFLQLFNFQDLFNIFYLGRTYEKTWIARQIGGQPTIEGRTFSWIEEKVLSTLKKIAAFGDGFPCLEVFFMRKKREARCKKPKRLKNGGDLQPVVQALLSVLAKNSSTVFIEDIVRARSWSSSKWTSRKTYTEDNPSDSMEMPGLDDCWDEKLPVQNTISHTTRHCRLSAIHEMILMFWFSYRTNWWFKYARIERHGWQL